MSSTRQAVILGPNLTGRGKRFDFTPAHQVRCSFVSLRIFDQSLPIAYSYCRYQMTISVPQPFMMMLRNPILAEYQDVI